MDPQQNGSSSLSTLFSFIYRHSMGVPVPCFLALEVLLTYTQQVFGT